MSETMISSIMMSIKEIQILTTSTTMVQITTTSTPLIKRTILIISSYVVIANSVKVLILFKNMVNLFRMLSNSLNNLTQIYAKESSNTLISGNIYITLQLNIKYAINANTI